MILMRPLRNLMTRRWCPRTPWRRRSPSPDVVVAVPSATVGVAALPPLHSWQMHVTRARRSGGPPLHPIVTLRSAAMTAGKAYPSSPHRCTPPPATTSPG